MSHNPRHLTGPARFIVTVISLVAGLGSYGALVTPAVAATTPVPIGQQPLNIPPPIPPDITLMLDDSGSMNADYMPDYGYLASQTNDAMINASNNGVYYNPSVTYTSPPNPDGTSYPNQADMTAVPPNGISNTLPSAVKAPYGPVDLTNYNGQYECDHSQQCGLNTDGSPKGHVYFSASVVGSTAATFSQDEPSGSACTAVYNSTPNAFGGTTFNNGGDQTVTGNCTFQYHPTNHYFQYSTGPATAPVVHYVASASQGCGGLNATTTPTCVLATAAGDGTNGAPAGKDSAGNSITVGENIANWFAYYHTRILMAKSGLMTAFADLNPGFRVGFGSINGNDAALISTFPNPYSFSTATQPNNYLAGVAPFGKSSDPSTTAGIARFNFWNWIKSESAWNNTPLRQSLDAVGQYYQTTTPWSWMASDPGYSTRGSAGNIACRQAYTILTTDGFWNSDYSSSATAGASDTAGPTFTPPSGQTYKGYTPADPFQGGGVSGGSSLADVAMYYWNHDLQGLGNEVVPNAQDPAYWQHMVTFTIGLGFTPTGITPAGTTTQQIFNWANDGGGATSKFAISGFVWPTPSSDSINNIADLEHAGVNGHGGFFSATDPQSFVNGLETALQSAAGRTSTGASLGANSTQLQTGTYIYQSEYVPGSWNGDLLALALNQATGAPDKTLWAATTELQKLGTASSSTPNVITYDKRSIWTWSYNGSSTGQAVQFKSGFPNSSGVSSNLSATQLAALGSTGTAQQNMVAYLRGDNTLEKKNNVGDFRNRTTPLGDIVDSQPIYNGAPDATEFNGQSFYGVAYQTDSSGNTTSPFYDYVSNEANRAGMIYVAANDGMLHVFNAMTGEEAFAYLPGALLINQTDPATGVQEPLSNLANPGYGGVAVPHQYYNDGQVTVADAYVALSQEGETSPSWHTILVGTTGKGPARAVYALDVTDPANIKPLWERYANDNSTLDSNSGYIGEVTGKPIIAQTNATTTSSTWSVVMGNGYNSPNGKAALLQFNLATGALSAYTTSDTSSQNGLAGVFTWMSVSGDGVADLAYAGDLDGNVYQFTLNDSTGANPSNASSATSNYTATLFTATNTGGTRQPITSQVTVAKNPADNNLWLFFGTGKYLTSNDVSDKSVQTWYGIIVTPGSTQVSTLASNLSNERSVLVQRSILAEQAGSGNTLSARVVTPMPSTPDITCSSKSKCKAGWYMDLVSPTATGGTLAQGERMVYPNSLQGGLLIGTTIIPQPANQSTDVCSPQGSGWIMALDPFTGTNPSQNFFDVNGDGMVGGGDSLTYGGKQVPAAGVGFGALTNAPIFVGGAALVSLNDATVRKVGLRGGTGSYQRVSWRELVNP